MSGYHSRQQLIKLRTLQLRLNQWIRRPRRLRLIISHIRLLLCTRARLLLLTNSLAVLYTYSMMLNLLPLPSLIPSTLLFPALSTVMLITTLVIVLMHFGAAMMPRACQELQLLL